MSLQASRRESKSILCQLYNSYLYIFLPQFLISSLKLSSIDAGINTIIFNLSDNNSAVATAVHDLPEPNSWYINSPL